MLLYLNWLGQNVDHESTNIRSHRNKGSGTATLHGTRKKNLFPWWREKEKKSIGKFKMEELLDEGSKEFFSGVSESISSSQHWLYHCDIKPLNFQESLQHWKQELRARVTMRTSPWQSSSSDLIAPSTKNL
jgi:hypothetical protein